MSISEDERLNLKKLLTESDCDDNTEYIRKVKHSVLIRDDVRKIDTLKNTYVELRKSDPDTFLEKCKIECVFLFNNYTDIFNKLIKDELDLGIMTQLLTVLKLIEDDKVDQHEGSVLVGKILKKLYVDSALKRGENLDKEHASEEKNEPNEGSNISWKDYKIIIG